MSQKYVKVDLGNLNQGAIGELFDRGIKRVLENIGDPSTAPDKARKLILTITVKPNKTRESATTTVKMDLGLAAILETEGTVILDGFGASGSIEAYTSTTKDQPLFEAEPVVAEEEKR